ncbi:MAG: hypothetical protein M1817_001079 [Caeruleum heppii]|nr:MAG: hypothetical protein M1817_001079 [Caeruleum heppii]
MKSSTSATLASLAISASFAHAQETVCSNIPTSTVTVTSIVTSTTSLTPGPISELPFALVAGLSGYEDSSLNTEAPTYVVINAPQPVPSAAPTGGYLTNAPGVGPTTTHKVEVGALGQLIFKPNQIEAAVGDVVEFKFLARNHSVTQSNFRTPCIPNGGVDLGFQFNAANASDITRSITITDTRPTWFYCKQALPVSHCGKGMVFGINPAGRMDAFIRNAEMQNGTGSAMGSGASGFLVPTGTGSPAATGTSGVAVTTVTVGLDRGRTLRFDPPFLQNKQKGEVIHFDFRFKNHTVTESSLNNPCKKLPGTLVDTNFQNVNDADIAGQNATDFTLDTDLDRPRFFYCKQANGTPNGHCSNGMVFAINTDDATYTKFVENARATLPKVKGRMVQRLGDVA